MPPIPSLSKPPLENSHKIDQHANRVCPFEYLIKGHGNCDSSAMARRLENCGTPECFHPKHCAREEIAARISSDLYFSRAAEAFQKPSLSCGTLLILDSANLTQRVWQPQLRNHNNSPRGTEDRFLVYPGHEEKEGNGNVVSSFSSLPLPFRSLSRNFASPSGAHTSPEVLRVCIPDTEKDLFFVSL